MVAVVLTAAVVSAQAAALQTDRSEVQ